jgi:O-antigen biosynthesis protein
VGSRPSPALSWSDRIRAGLRTIFVRATRGPATRYEGLEQGYICWVDEPADWLRVTHRFRLSGWCFSRDTRKIDALRASLSDYEFVVSYGLTRPDVAAAYPDQPGALRSGFEVMIEAPRGAVHRLRFEALHSDGSWREVFSKRIVVTRKAGGSYEDWVRQYDTLRWGDRHRIQKQIQTYALKPRFSILLPVSKSNAGHLNQAIKSVRAQLYLDWQLVVLADASLPEEKRHLLARLAERDSRIKVRQRDEQDQVTDALNEAMALTESEYICFLGSEDKLAPTALCLLADAINKHPDACLFYSDEDSLDTLRLRTNPHFKSDWNWPLLLAQNFVSQLTVFRTGLLKSLGFRQGFGGVHEYDLLLRFAEKIGPHQILHIPRVLYHRRIVPQSDEVRQRLSAGAIRAVEQHLERHQIRAEVSLARDSVSRRVRYLLPEVQPTVSIIIPTRDRVELLKPCVQSILEKTAYSNFELIVIDNGSSDAAALQYLASLSHDPRVRVLRHDEEFNYSRLSNCGVGHSNAEFVLLMNNDVSVIEPGWLEEMVGHGIQPGVGAVGARLLYPDNRVQQAGVILGAGVHGVAEVAHRGIARGDRGYFSRAILAQELSAVGAACMLVKREAYLQVGGFDEEHLKIAFNDIDFCLKLRAQGYRIIYTPEAELYHHEHASRGSEYTEANEQRFIREIQFVKEKWKDALLADPAYNPNLSLGRELFTFSFPPRVRVIGAALCHSPPAADGKGLLLSGRECH